MIIFFIALGFIFLLIEVLITPGIIVGAIGILFMGFGVLKTFEAYGAMTGNIVLLSVFLLAVFFVFGALKSGAWKRMASTESIDGKAVDDFADMVTIGDMGKSLSALRPTGNAYINGSRMEVQSEGEPIDANTEVEVIKIKQNKVFVKKV